MPTVRASLYSQKRRSRGWLSPIWLQGGACGAHENFISTTIFSAPGAEKIVVEIKFS